MVLTAQMLMRAKKVTHKGSCILLLFFSSANELASTYSRVAVHSNPCLNSWSITCECDYRENLGYPVLFFITILNNVLTQSMEALLKCGPIRISSYFSRTVKKKWKPNIMPFFFIKFTALDLFLLTSNSDKNVIKNHELFT